MPSPSVADDAGGPGGSVIDTLAQAQAQNAQVVHDALNESPTGVAEAGVAAADSYCADNKSTEKMLSPFYSRLADELGNEHGAKALKVKAALKGEYAMTRLADQWELTAGQFDSVLARAGATPAWRRTIEQRGGGKFAEVDCPSSVRLLVENGRVTKAKYSVPKGEVATFIENTLSDELGRGVIDTIVVPPCVLFCAGISDPRSWNGQPVGKFVDILGEYGAWVFSLWGKQNVGTRFIDACAKQYHDAYPSIDLEVWTRKLKRKNMLLARPDAKVRALPPSPHPKPNPPPTPPSNPRALTPVCATRCSALTPAFSRYLPSTSAVRGSKAVPENSAVRLGCVLWGQRVKHTACCASSVTHRV